MRRTCLALACLAAAASGLACVRTGGPHGNAYLLDRFSWYGADLETFMPRAKAFAEIEDAEPPKDVKLVWTAVRPTKADYEKDVWVLAAGRPGRQPGMHVYLLRLAGDQVKQIEDYPNGIIPPEAAAVLAERENPYESPAEAAN